MPQKKQHECKFEDKIIEMYADIKWLRRDTERRNGIFNDHIKTSDSFRAQVERNTTWRHAYKYIIGFIITVLVLMLRLHFTG